MMKDIPVRKITAQVNDAKVTRRFKIRVVASILTNQHVRRALNTMLHFQTSHMKLLLPLLLTLFFLQISHAQQTGKPIVIGTVESMYSSVLNEEGVLGALLAAYYFYIERKRKENKLYGFCY